MKNIATLYNDEVPDETVYGIGGVWYAAYRSELTVLTNVTDKITKYTYEDGADMETAMRAIRRYGKVETAAPTPSNKGNDIIDAFFRAEGEVRE